MAKRKCRPSGRNAGCQCALSPRLWSSVVTGVGRPPSAATLNSRRPVENMIVLVALQVLPTISKSGAVQTQMVAGDPPAVSIRLIVPRETNPIVRLSGDQKAYDAPSVP